MITHVKIKDYGPFDSLEWKPGAVNLILAENGRGKTFLLKAMYTAVKALETYGRGNQSKSFTEVLSEKLEWTFQTNNGIGDLVRKGGSRRLDFSAEIDEKFLSYSFTASATREPGHVDGNYAPRNDISVFLPAKEVLSLFDAIANSRRVQQVFGFDDTYLDLITYLETEPERGRNYKVFSQIRKRLDKMLDGRIVREGGKWFYRQGNTKVGIYQTAEGIKKIAILHRLLGNKTLAPGSIIFVDEPEAALHPSFVLEFVEMLFDLAGMGMQVFMASHSYFVLKKYYLLARQAGAPSSSILSIEKGATACTHSLEEGLPDSSIVRASIQLYEEELEQDL